MSANNVFTGVCMTLGHPVTLKNEKPFELKSNVSHHPMETQNNDFNSAMAHILRNICISQPMLFFFRQRMYMYKDD